MNAKQTYIIIISLMACLLASCASDAPEPTGPAEGTELTFTVSGLSRATVTTDISTPGSKFAVYGDRFFGQADSATPDVLFDKTIVEYTDNGWRYDNPQLWFPKHEHSFVAIYPLAIVEGGAPLYSASKLSFSYTIPATAGNEIVKNTVTDILTATHRRYYEEGDKLPVSFRFSHLMSLVNIAPALSNNAMSASAYVQFRKIEITGLKNKASFQIVPAKRQTNAQTDDRVIEVSGQEGENRMIIEFANPPKIMNGAGNISLFDADDAMIMLPQTFTADSQAKIILTYTLNDEQETRVISSPLSLQDWTPGKSYTYKFTFDGLRLTHGSTEINDWIRTVEGTGDAVSE